MTCIPAIMVTALILGPAALRAQERTTASGVSMLSAIPAVSSASAPPRALSMLAGAVVGGVAGYLATANACRSCDEPAPLLFGTALGATAGASLAFFISVSRNRASGSGSSAAMSEPARRLIAARVRLAF
ncbi:MAG: hypothetical protein LH467_15340 [Gemmatimonadaceae bacterium]|nr:hypothetical protein [Gemmatimonadaceae bacterium]